MEREGCFDLYLKRILNVNSGPVNRLDILANFDCEGRPKPIIFVGENGSGKSTVISNIVDSFYEIAGEFFSNARHHNDFGGGYNFFKVISALQIRIGAKYMFSMLQYDSGIDYIFKAGECSLDEFKLESGFQGDLQSWDKVGNKKYLEGVSREKVISIFENNVFCYMGPERYEKPEWLGESYYEDSTTHLNIEQRYEGKLRNPISMTCAGKDNLKWLLDVIVDSRTDIELEGENLKSVHVDVNNLVAMSLARKNVERVMSEILGRNVYFGLNLRRYGGGRFNIKDVENDVIIAPTMDSLSTGQLALFNIFATIIRYADNNDITKSIHLEDIQGIVVIDEIDLHLHTILQREVLPKLLNLFPKVQFIITTHAPLFLLGMESIYGSDGFDIYQMPDSTNISVERFSEFERAYSYFTKTQKYREQREQLIEAIKKAQAKTLIVTEGSTDWKHMLAALNYFRNNPQSYSSILELLGNEDFDFFRYEPANSPVETENKINMGNDALCAMCEVFSKVPQVSQKRKLIFIADCDDERTNKKLSIPGKSYKKWGNNVYSLILPVPESRRMTPKICIEHYYSDDEIKTEYEEDGIRRRLFLGYEFDDRGINSEAGFFCYKKSACGAGKIDIIEGSSGEKVTKICDDGKNYALPKSKFVSLILNKAKGFNSFNFFNFIELFKVIGSILNDKE